MLIVILSEREKLYFDQKIAMNDKFRLKPLRSQFKITLDEINKILPLNIN